MGVLDKFLNVMRLNPDDDEDDFYNEDYYDEDDDYEEEKPAKRRRKEKEPEDDFFEDDRKGAAAKEKTVKTTPKVTPMRPRKQGNGMEVCVIKPSSVEDSREITETLLMNRTVVLNVEGLDLEIAQRIIDFTSGSCFAISGNLQKISNYIFIITPPNVDISGDFLNIVDTFDATLKKDF